MKDGFPDCPLMDAALEIVETDVGAVLEDAARGRVHYINGTAAYILSLCDGETDIAAIARHVQTEFALVDAPLAVVVDILRQFTAERVVAWGLGSRE